MFLFLHMLCAGQNAFNINHHSRLDYNGGNQNWSIDIDENGFIYVANNDGLLVYDGSRWEKYRSEEQTVIRSVCVESENRIFVGSFEDFGYWTNLNSNPQYVSLKPLVKGFSFHNDEIWKIVRHNGKVYFQGFSSLFVYENQTVKSIKLPGLILFLLKTDNRLFFQEVNGGVYELVNDIPVLLPGTISLQNSEVKTINKLSNGNLLIGTTADGLFQYDGTLVKPWNCSSNEQLKRNQINNALVFDNKIVIGTIVNGIYVLDNEGYIKYQLNSENGLQNNTVLSLCNKDNSTLWIGLDRGIDQINFNSPVVIYQQPDLKLGAVYSAALKDNRLYVGTNRGIFTYQYSAENETFKFDGFIDKSQGQVWMIKDIDGTLFCGHNSGTSIIENGALTKISNVTGGYNLIRIYKNGVEYLLQGTYTSLVLYEKANNRWKIKQQIKGYFEPSRYIETDHLGNIWIGHAVKGLYRLRLSDNLDSVVEKAYYGKQSGFESDLNIKVFKIENRVVFTTGKKLYTWDDMKNKIIPYAEINNSLNEFSESEFITPAQPNHYWMCTPDEYALFRYTDNSPDIIYRLLLSAYGINAVEKNDNVVVLNDHLSLVCLDNGFGIVNHNKIIGKPNQRLQLIWRSIECTNGLESKELASDEKSIPYSFNNVNFAFTVLHDNSSNNIFQYRLLPIEKEWSKWTTLSLIKYSRLTDGKYIFQVRTMDDSGFISKSIEYHFKVRPPFYASTLAMILYSLVALILIIIAFKVYRRRLTAKHLRAQSEIERTAILEKEKSESMFLQLSNEKLHNEVLHKNMQLANSTMSIIRKNEVLIEIKKELETQKEILANRYPQRYFDRLNHMIDRNISDDNDWLIFESLFDQAHEDFFKRLKTSYPELTQSDLKLCAYLKLNLASKEIAPLLNISIRGVEIRRYRLRKRLSLDSDTNLVEFIMQF
jgi:hypothetical protein